MRKIVSSLREIAADSLPVSSRVGSKPLNSVLLTRSFALLEKVRLSQERWEIKEVISVSREYEALISMSNPESRHELLALMASEATPVHTLQAFYGWSRERDTSCRDFLPILRSSLERSATLRSRREMSATLLRLEKARANNEGTTAEVNSGENAKRRQRTLWRLMASGDDRLTIDK
jgi:hypothetical protein